MDQSKHVKVIFKTIFVLHIHCILNRFFSNQFLHTNSQVSCIAIVIVRSALKLLLPNVLKFLSFYTIHTLLPVLEIKNWKAESDR